VPGGLFLSSAGVLSGTPTSPFNSFFTVQASGSNGTVQKVISLLIVSNTPQALAITTGSLTYTTIGAGAALLALQMGVPVVPIHMGGTFHALPRDAKWPRFVPVTLRIGEPIPVAPRRKPSSEEIAALTEFIRGAIADLGASGG